MKCFHISSLATSLHSFGTFWDRNIELIFSKAHNENSINFYGINRTRNVLQSYISFRTREPICQPYLCNKLWQPVYLIRNHFQLINLDNQCSIKFFFLVSAKGKIMHEVPNKLLSLLLLLSITHISYMHPSSANITPFNPLLVCPAKSPFGPKGLSVAAEGCSPPQN